MTDVQVYVALDDDDVLAGTLYSHRRRSTESATFAYAASYLARPDAYALDPELPLRAGASQTRAGRALFGALTDCAPDRWGRTLLSRREAALARAEGRAARALGELDYLLGVRDDVRQGALRFRRGTGPFLTDDDTGVPALTDLPSLLALASRVETDTADLPDLQRLFHAGGSLGGARPKAHVLDTQGRVAIAKFPSASHDTWNVMAWEKVALDLAHDAGVVVPRSQLLRLADRHVLVVDRFDRTAHGRRIGYCSAMTMLEAGDGDERSYLEIAEVVERSSARATEELQQLWRRMLFSVLIANTDDHLRNHGFLHRRGDVWSLAPAFDLNPNPSPGPLYLTTSIDGGGGEASISAALAVAGSFRLSATASSAVVAEMVGAVGRWREVARAHGLSASEVAAMAPAFRAVSHARDH